MSIFWKKENQIFLEGCNKTASLKNLHSKCNFTLLSTYLNLFSLKTITATEIYQWL